MTSGLFYRSKCHESYVITASAANYIDVGVCVCVCVPSRMLELPSLLDVMKIKWTSVLWSIKFTSSFFFVQYCAAKDKLFFSKFPMDPHRRSQQLF